MKSDVPLPSLRETIVIEKLAEQRGQVGNLGTRVGGTYNSADWGTTSETLCLPATSASLQPAAQDSSAL